MPAYFHLVMGGFAFGTIFMATDPVSAAATPKGQLIYGFLIGFLTVIIRAVNPAYLEGMMLAILFMNMMAPLSSFIYTGSLKYASMSCPSCPSYFIHTVAPTESIMSPHLLELFNFIISSFFTKIGRRHKFFVLD